VSVQERVAKLGALLARVTERARAPRTPNGAAAASATTPQSDNSAADIDELLGATTQDGAAAPVLTVDEPFSPAHRAEGEVEIVSEVVVDDEEGFDGAEAPDMTLRDELPSRERMVAATPSAAVDPAPPRPLPLPVPLKADDEETKEIELPAAETGERPAASKEAAEPQLDADTEVPPEVTVTDAEEAEEPPASSRRPIALEPKLEELAFGEATPSEKPHAPPPESGRQVAAPPVELDFESEFTGVRPRDAEPTPPAPSARKSERPAAMAKPMDVSPEVTAAHKATEPSAVFEGTAPVFKPATFGELLDATLEL
jgi:hypothetical protein